MISANVYYSSIIRRSIGRRSVDFSLTSTMRDVFHSPIIFVKSTELNILPADDYRREQCIRSTIQLDSNSLFFLRHLERKILEITLNLPKRRKILFKRFKCLALFRRIPILAKAI